MWSNCLFVALGGGLGAVGRYLLSLIAAPWSFPVMTLLTNFLGAVVIGAVAQAAGQLPMSKSAVLFLKTGLCGGFTTFSTFSLETVELLEQGRWAAGGGYILASVGPAGAGPGVEDPLRMETRICGRRLYPNEGCRGEKIVRTGLTEKGSSAILVKQIYINSLNEMRGTDGPAG